MHIQIPILSTTFITGNSTAVAHIIRLGVCCTRLRVYLADVCTAWNSYIVTLLREAVSPWAAKHLKELRKQKPSPQAKTSACVRNETS